MPPFGPISHAAFVRALRQLGWDGPYPGGKHLIMRQGTVRLIIPNPHQGDIGVHLLTRLLRQAGIDRASWEQV
jgi:predicted RNA binding protein YcfA (HicA-like mRNA interferase family)